MDTTTDSKSLQERYAPRSLCFGCGPSNAKGLRIRTFKDPARNEWTCAWKPEKHHEAFPGVLNGGIIGALMDCHSNWAASHFLMLQNGLREPPCSVTAEFSVKLRRPAPTDGEVTLKAKILESGEDRAKVSCELIAGGKACATCEGVFVAVKPDHPAYHRW